MIIKTYHIITNNITQIINSTLNSNSIFSFLNKYAKVDPIKLDQSGLNWTK